MGTHYLSEALLMSNTMYVVSWVSASTFIYVIMYIIILYDNVIWIYSTLSARQTYETTQKLRQWELLFLCSTPVWPVLHTYLTNTTNSKVTEYIKFHKHLLQGEIAIKLRQWELLFLYVTCLLDLFYRPTKISSNYSMYLKMYWGNGVHKTS